MALLATLVMTFAGCSGSSSSGLSNGFGGGCEPTGPQLGGVAKMGTSNRGLVTDIDATIAMTGSTDGGLCTGAYVDTEDDDRRRDSALYLP